jgi:hypothetical protein
VKIHLLLAEIDLSRPANGDRRQRPRPALLQYPEILDQLAIRSFK